MKSKKWLLVSVMFVCMLGFVVQAERVISTADDNGADTWLRNDQGSQNDTNGSDVRMQLRLYDDGSAVRCRIPYFRFDISSLNGSLFDAVLQVDEQEKDSGSVIVWSVYGLNDDVEGNDWDEGTTSYNNAPGFIPGTEGEYNIDTTEMTYLGTISYPGGNYRGPIQSNTTDLNLDSFLNADTDGLVTFALFEFDSNKEWYLVTKEREASNPEWFAPRLIVPDPTVEAVYPINGQIDVELDVTLQWDGLSDPNNPDLLDPNVIAHNVYIDFDNTDGDPNLVYQDQVVVTDWSSRGASYGPLSLSLDDSVSWQIEEVKDTGSGTQGDPNNILSPVFSFTAIKSTPIVSQDQPDSVRVFPAESAVFSVDFSSISAPTVRWYKDDNSTVTEILTGISTTDNGGGSYTTTLELTASAGDEGQYYCTVQNSSGPTEYPSGVADLVVKRQLADYEFEGNLTDSSSNGAPTGTAVDSLGDPNTATHVAGTVDYVAGADGGSALYLDPNEYINFGTDGYPKASAATTNGFGGGLDEGTLVFWIKPNSADADQTVLANFNPNPPDRTGFLSMFTPEQEVDIYLRDAGGTTILSHPQGKPDRPEYDLLDGAWHMMAICWGDSAASLYVDGQLVVDGSGATPSSFAAWQYGTLLGAARTGDRTFLTGVLDGGAIDNMRVYNYRLDDTGTDVFAQEYLDNTGIRPCINTNFLDGLIDANFDNTGSSYCVINLADFAAFAETWLASGLY